MNCNRTRGKSDACAPTSGTVRGRHVSALIIGAVFGAFPTCAEASEKLVRALEARALRKAEVAAFVVRAADSAVIFEHRADRALIPASNQKVLTALAALATFGPAHRFRTVIASEAAPDSGGAVELLVVRGAGDPGLTSEQWWRLAADLRRTGLRHVRGALMIDDSTFDAERWNPLWGGASARAYHAPIGAVSANYGAFTVYVQPGRTGEPARVFLDPPVPYLRLVNQTKTGGGKPSLGIDRRDAADHVQVTVTGTVSPASGEQVYHRSVSDPALYAGSVLRMQMEANGIRVDGPIRTGRAPAAQYQLIAFEGPPLADTVRLMMKYSNNNIAESLVKAMAAHETQRPGTWKDGVAVMEQRLRSLGVELSGARLVDGSGLSYQNRVSPRALVSALRVAHTEFGWGPEFLASLPLSGTDGTLARRANAIASRVRAKTGLLHRTTGLSGYARREDGSDVIFSILVNNYTAGDHEVLRAIDHFVQQLVELD